MMKEIRIGDTITLAGHQLKLLRIEKDSIVYELQDRKAKQRINTYGLTAFRKIARMYNMELVQEGERE